MKSFVQGSLTAGFLVVSIVVILMFVRSNLAVGQAGGGGGLTSVSSLFQPEQGWQYWEVCEGGARCTAPLRYGDGVSIPENQEKFLLLETRGCGFNNERHSVEQAFALAYLWKRTLVLPPWMGPPIYPDDLYAPSDVFDLAAMNTSIKIMTAEEFVAFAQAHSDRFGGQVAVSQLGVNPRNIGANVPWEAFPGWFRGTNWLANNIFLHMNFTGSTVLAGTPQSMNAEEYRAFATPMRTDPPMSLSNDDWEAPVLRFPPRAMLGNYYAKIYIEGAAKRAEVRHAIRQTVRLRPEYYQAAAAAMAAGGLSLGQFGAIHNRQGDWHFAHWSLYLEPTQPGLFTDQPENRHFLSKTHVLYVASNPNATQAQNMINYWYPGVKEFMPEPKRIVTLTGSMYQAAAAHVGQFKGWTAMIDMIICSRSEEFLGTWGSTFSGYIHRLRGYMPDVQDKRILFFERAQERQFSGLWPSWQAATAAGEIEMAVEWPEGFSDTEGPVAGGSSSSSNPLAMIFR